MSFKKHGKCPFCSTEQDFMLAGKAMLVIKNLINMATSPHMWYYQFIRSVYSVVIQDAKSTPELECIHCQKHFVECPHCHATTLLQDEPQSQVVNCKNCRKPLDVSENW